MRKVIVAFITICSIVSCIFADELLVKSFYSFSEDISAINSPKKDINANFCAIIKIRTDIPNLKVNSLQLTELVPKKEVGEYWAYVSPGIRIIDLWADGYILLSYHIQEKIESSKVYILELTGKGEYTQNITENYGLICLNYSGSVNEMIYGHLDGKIQSYNFQQGSVNIRMKPGNHTIKLNNDGKIWEQSFSIENGDEKRFKVEFSSIITEESEKKNPGTLEIDSEPKGAIVYSNGAEIGITPLNNFSLMPGEYSIQLIKPYYKNKSFNITINPLETISISANEAILEGDFCKLDIRTKPDSASIFLNDKLIGTSRLFLEKYQSGIYNLRIEKPLYYDYKDKVELVAGKDFIEIYNLEPKYGLLSFNTEPPGDTVLIDGKYNGNIPIKNLKIASGSHIISVKKKDYYDYTAQLNIKDNAKIERDIKLNTKVGKISVICEPHGADVILHGSEKNKIYRGKTPYNESVEPDNYKIIVSMENYNSFEVESYVLLGQTTTIDQNLKYKTGNIRISTNPKGTSVFLDGIIQKTDITKNTNYIRDVKIGSHEILLKKSGYDIQKFNIMVNENEITEINKNLEDSLTKQWMSKKRNAQKFALVLPGSGQFLSGQPIRGTIYSAAFIGSVGLIAKSYIDYSTAKNNYDKYMDEYSSLQKQTDIDAAYKNASQEVENIKTSDTMIQTAAFTCAGIYCIQLIDALIWGGGDRPTSVTSSFYLEPQYSYRTGTCLKLSIPIGGSK